MKRLNRRHWYNGNGRPAHRIVDVRVTCGRPPLAYWETACGEEWPAADWEDRGLTQPEDACRVCVAAIGGGGTP